MVKFSWDKLKRFLAQANTWTGQQTFSNIAITGGTISGVTMTENFTTSTDPATNAAVSTTIVNTYNGVIVTLTGAGNTQTLQNPTTAATIRKFLVINNDTSTHNLPVVANSVTFTLTPGEGQCFIWDGSAWGPTDLGITDIPVLTTQGGTGRATGTTAYALVATGTTATGAQQTLAKAGAATEILVGGGASALPVWTTATGSGAPVRATSPTLVTPVLGTPTSGDLKNCSAATDALKGVVELATNAETLTGTDTERAVTPDDLKYVLNRYQPRENLIGIPGQMGFGVGICPLANLPTGMTPMAGYDQLGHDNYGNYQFTDGSVMIWVPKFYYRYAHASNPTYATYGLNSVDIKGVDTYATTTEANAAGYALHRAFIDGGAEKLGFFRDKYKWSKVANGTGFTAGSVKNGLPLSSAAGHNPFADCTGGANFNYSAIDLAHRRDGVNGDVNASSIFFASSIFMRGAIAMLSLAHGQAATSTANCAWYLTNKNYPKGCNNNALSDTDDTTVKWESDGYETATGVYACGKTGSAGYGGGAGNVFAKSTHNGQNCGSADDNGLMYEVATGFTCIAATKAIEGITQANHCVITITEHGLENGDVMQIGTAITQADWVGLNNKVWPITKLTDNTFSVAFDSSAIATAYNAGADPGTCVLGKFYVAKEATAMKDFTQDDTTETGHWGATGVAAMMDRIVMPWGDGDALVQKFGDGTNQVLSEATSGVGYILAGMGFPKDASGNSPTGTNLFGLDYYYTYVINDLFLFVSYAWNATTNAGVWSVHFYSYRTLTNVYMGARSACYHV